MLKIEIKHNLNEKWQGNKFLRLYAEIGQLILEVLGLRFERDFNVQIFEEKNRKEKSQISVEFIGLECEEEVRKNFTFLLKGIFTNIFPDAEIKIRSWIYL